MQGSMQAAAGAPVRQRTHWTDRCAHAAMALVALALVAFLALPLISILQQAVEGKEGEFVGLANFIAYAQTPALLNSLWNSVWVSVVVTLITVPLAFGFAYALARSCMPLKSLFRGITLIPLLAPSLLSAISLIYWFGNQGVLKSLDAGCGHLANLRRARDCGGGVLCRISPCVDDSGDGAQPVGCPPV
jgi:iron(III) transport system permease protein